jgi:hypothetical protein
MKTSLTADTPVHSNNLTLFSNGIGHFRRVYSVDAKDCQQISIPFKRDHIGDVAASLQVFGNVKLVTPPSFTPSNSNATALRIDQTDAYISLLTGLSGAQVSVIAEGKSAQKFTLLGIDQIASAVDGLMHQNFLVLLNELQQVARYDFRNVNSISFIEESVRAEIAKALQNNFQKIKPDSTLLDISLSSLNGQATTATIQYTIPVAAWKMRYAIYQDGGRFFLEGAAIIDNNTDEDWDGFYVSVVTGNPISFSTDIANIVVPHRKMIPIVDGASQDVVYDSGTTACSAGEPMAPATRGRKATRGLGPKMSTANYVSFGLEAVDVGGGYEAPIAESAGVDSKDVGDFCVYTSKEPITLLSRKSAIVPMFKVVLQKAGLVLLYKESNNARRPYRTIKFKNETQYSLGKGKTIIYNEGVLSGECVLDMTKPGENRMLPHCLENGVKIEKQCGDLQRRRSNIKIDAGVAYSEEVYTVKTTYTVVNKKDELFKIALEHENVLTNKNNQVSFEGLEFKDKEKLQDRNGYRVYFELQPNATVTFNVVEIAHESESIHLGNHNDTFVRWFQVTLDQDNPLRDNEKLKACLAIHAKIQATQTEIESLRELREVNEQSAQRFRNNLAAVKDANAATIVTEWVANLDTTDKTITRIDKIDMPALQKKVQELEKQFYDALKQLTVAWQS